MYKYIQIIWHSEIVTSHVVRNLALLFPRNIFSELSVGGVWSSNVVKFCGGRGEYVLLVPKAAIVCISPGVTPWKISKYLQHSQLVGGFFTHLTSIYLVKLEHFPK